MITVAIVAVSILAGMFIIFTGVMLALAAYRSYWDTQDEVDVYKRSIADRETIITSKLSKEDAERLKSCIQQK